MYFNQYALAGNLNINILRITFTMGNTATRLVFIACIIHAHFLTSTLLYYPHQYWNKQWEEVISSAVYVCHKWTKTSEDSRIWYQSNKTCMLIAIQYFNPRNLVWSCNWIIRHSIQSKIKFYKYMIILKLRWIINSNISNFVTWILAC